MHVLKSGDKTKCPWKPLLARSINLNLTNKHTCEKDAAVCASLGTLSMVK